MKVEKSIVMLLITGVTIISMLPSLVFAHENTVVLPLFEEDERLHNVVTVAKQNGDFSDPIAAMKSISGASSSNRFLLIIGPGIYRLSETLVIKDYVDVIGSGQEVTVLKADGDIELNLSATVVGGESTKLTDLTVEHFAEGNVSAFIGIYIGSDNMELKNVTINVSGATGGSTGILIDGSVGGNDLPKVKISHTNVSVTDGNVLDPPTSSCVGILQALSSVTISNTRVTVSNCSRIFGINSIQGSTLRGTDLFLNVFAGQGDFAAGVRVSNQSDIPNLAVFSGLALNVNVSKGSQRGISSVGFNNVSISNSKITVGGVIGGGRSFAVRSSPRKESPSSNRINISNSLIDSDDIAIEIESDQGTPPDLTYISDSELNGTVVAIGAADEPKCYFTFSNSGEELQSDCRP